MKTDIKKICILTNKNSWMNKYNDILCKELKKKNIIIKKIYNHKNIIKSDILLIYSYSSVIPKKYLKLNKYNIVTHASNLPKGRGFSPISWEILKNKKNFYLTFFEATEKIDDGKIYHKIKFSISKTDLSHEWRNQLGSLIVYNTIKIIKEKKYLKSKKQIGKSTYYKKRKKIDSLLSINKTIKDQFNLLRIVDNNIYPAYFEYKGFKYIIRINKLNEKN